MGSAPLRFSSRTMPWVAASFDSCALASSSGPGLESVVAAVAPTAPDKESAATAVPAMKARVADGSGTAWVVLSDRPATGNICPSWTGTSVLVGPGSPDQPWEGSESWRYRTPILLAEGHGEDVHRGLALVRALANIGQRDVLHGLALLQRHRGVVHAHCRVHPAGGRVDVRGARDDVAARRRLVRPPVGEGERVALRAAVRVGDRPGP